VAEQIIILEAQLHRDSISPCTQCKKHGGLAEAVSDRTLWHYSATEEQVRTDAAEVDLRQDGIPRITR